jgi:TM2 domain-containing membrane protein YozV
MEQMKSKTTAAILAFFLGGFGVHRFYLKQSGLGALYLLFFWTFVPAIVAFVDFIIFLTMDDNAFNAKYNNNFTKSPVNVSDELEKLYKLKEKGIITMEEFEYKKKQLL